jgi:ribosome-binding factor A
MKSFRPQRVANVIREVVSEAIAGKLSDPRIGSLVSVTRVEVTADLEHAKVFFSVMGPPAAERRTMQGLQSAVGVVQRMVARELSIRQCPKLSFHLDETIKRTAETLRIINETMAEYEERPVPESESAQSQAPAPGEDEGADEARGSDNAS